MDNTIQSNIANKMSLKSSNRRKKFKRSKRDMN